MPAAACHDAAAAATAPIGRNRPVCTAWPPVDRPRLVPDAVRPLTIIRKYASAADRPTSFKVKAGGQAIAQHRRPTAQHMTRPHGQPHPAGRRRSIAIHGSMFSRPHFGYANQPSRLRSIPVLFIVTRMTSRSDLGDRKQEMQTRRRR